MFGFLKALRPSSPRGRPSPRRRASHRPLFDQLGGAFFESGSGGRPASFKPAVEALEERQLMSLTAAPLASSINLGNLALTQSSPQLRSIGAGTLVSGVSANPGNFAVMQPIPQQQFSHLTSVSDDYYGTVDFEITADYSVWFLCATGDYAGQARDEWHSTGGYALSVSAGRSVVAARDTAAVYIIAGDHSVWRFDSQGVWTPLGNYALSISGADEGSDYPYGNQVYAIGRDSNLWVYQANWPSQPSWKSLGSPGNLATISAAAGQGAVFATDIYGEVWEYYNPNDPYSNGYWTFTGGLNTVQIAASYDGTSTPMVYALTTDHEVRAYEQGRWWDLNMYALEISAFRVGEGGASNTVYAIGADHSAYLAHPNWTGATTIWQNLDNYVTAISAEAGVVQPGGSITGSSLSGYQVFATGQTYSAVEWASYNGAWGWAGLFGPDMLAQPTPLK
jgi:hypothetical protein